MTRAVRRNGIETRRGARRLLRMRARETARRILAPPPKLTVTEWADRYRWLSPEGAAEPGPWRTIAYQRGIMDACGDRRIRRVVLMLAAQLGKSEILNNVLGFHIDQDPCPVLFVQPTSNTAKTYSADRLATMIRDTPRLREKVRDARSRDGSNSTLHKAFPGGVLNLAGAESPAELAGRPVRVVLFDEVDRFTESAGGEGDPVDLGSKRTTTFWNRKEILTSTPTLKGISRIEAAFEETDQRRYYVACPECGHRQSLKWANVQWFKFGKDEPRPKGKGAAFYPHKPETAFVGCEGCGVAIDEVHKEELIDGGEWIAENPGAASVGFHMNALYSLFLSWRDLVEEHLLAKTNPLRRQTFVNTRLAETFDLDGETIRPDDLRRRREAYPVRGKKTLLPRGVGVLTAGADTQGDRVEIVIKGWGRGEESWLIRRAIVMGDPAKASTWAKVDAVLARAYEHESGAFLTVAAALVDSGGGHTESVYRFTKPRAGRKVFACKGKSVRGAPLLSRPSKGGNKLKTTLFLIGTDTAKDLIFARLRVTERGPNYMHFPNDVGEDYFDGLTSEKVRVNYKKGVPYREYVKVSPGVRNEPLDCEVYATAALLLVDPEIHANLGAYVAQVNAAGRRSRVARVAAEVAEDLGAEDAALETDDDAEGPADEAAEDAELEDAAAEAEAEADDARQRAAAEALRKRTTETARAQRRGGRRNGGGGGGWVRNY